MDSREIQPRVGNGSRARSEEIKAAIDHTRHRMDETLDELGEKFHPRQLFWDLMDYLRTPSPEGRSRMKETTSKVGQSIWHQVQEHPMPSMLIGAGLAWMLMEQQSRHHPEYAAYLKANASGKLSEFGDSAGQTGHGTVESIRQKGSQAADHIKHAASERTARLKQATLRAGAQVRDQVRERASRAYHFGEHKLSEAAEHNPVALGVGVLAFGLLAGLALPRTETEDELIGETSDDMKDRARRAGQQGLEKAKEVASAASGAAMEEAKQHGITPENIANTAKEIGREAKEAAQERAGAASGQHSTS